MMNTKALSYMDCVILSLIRRYDLSEQAATNAVKKSYLYELLQNEPEETMHDSVNDSADDVYYEIFEKAYLMTEDYANANALQAYLTEKL